MSRPPTTTVERRHAPARRRRGVHVLRRRSAAAGVRRRDRRYRAARGRDADAAAHGEARRAARPLLCDGRVLGVRDRRRRPDRPGLHDAGIAGTDGRDSARAPRVIETDLAIVGAGPAGLAAAGEALARGSTVTLLDDNPMPGGQYFRQPPTALTRAAHAADDADHRRARALFRALES